MLSSNINWHLNLPIDFFESLVNVEYFLWRSVILVIWIISVPSKEMKVLSDLEILEVVWIYMNELPIGGKLVAPERPVGLFVCVDFMKSRTLESLFWLLHLICHFCKSSEPTFGGLNSFVSVICILLWFVRL